MAALSTDIKRGCHVSPSTKALEQRQHIATLFILREANRNSSTHVASGLTYSHANSVVAYLQPLLLTLDVTLQQCEYNSSCQQLPKHSPIREQINNSLKHGLAADDSAVLKSPAFIQPVYKNDRLQKR
jgi:hypothetical protein